MFEFHWMINQMKGYEQYYHQERRITMVNLFGKE